MPVDDQHAHAAPHELIGEHQPGRAGADDQNVGIHSSPHLPCAEALTIVLTRGLRRGALRKLNLNPNIDHDLKKGMAWVVHAFTTCGIVLGFLALVAVLKNDPVAAFMWLGLALFVDGIDGSLARKARVLEYTPNFDGRTLDNVIDFFNYVAVPALMVYWFAMVPRTPGASISRRPPRSWRCRATLSPMTGMKSDDYYFVGFPALWNVVVLYFYILGHALDRSTWSTIAALSVLTFIPIKFVHPLRVTDWREITIPMTVLWAALSLSLIISAKDRPALGHGRTDRTVGMGCGLGLFHRDFAVADLLQEARGSRRSRRATQLDFARPPSLYRRHDKAG